MTSQYQPLLYDESCSQYPYICRESIAEEDHVDFIYQFVKNKKFFAEHDSNPSTFCTASDIIGAPTKFPNYGHLPDTFVGYMKGISKYPDISISPWQNEAFLKPIDFITRNTVVKEISDYIDIEFHEAVYPIRISIYEIYNPGNVTGIWALDSDNQRWSKLWSVFQSPIIPVPSTSRLFSPPLLTYKLKTKRLLLRLRNPWSHYTKLDAVMLIGTTELIHPRNPEQSLTNLLKTINSNLYSRHEDVHNLTVDFKNAHLDIIHLQENFSEYCIICKSDIETNDCNNWEYNSASRELIPNYLRKLLRIRQRYSHRLLLNNCSNSAKRRKLSLHEFEELSHCNFSALSDEVILKILKYLNLMSLCYMNKVSRRFYNLTQDFCLYTRLNVRYVRSRTYINKIYCYFASRCKKLQQFDLTSSNFSVEQFITFLNHCGKHLTHLRLSQCSINNYALLKISEICKNLKELDLSHCQCIDNEGFVYLKNLEGLEHLNLCDTHINAETLCKILQKNQRMRELNLKLLSIDLNLVAIELRNSCQDLETINLQFTRSLTEYGINALADCKNLRKVNLCREQCYDRNTLTIAYTNDSLHRLFSSCQRLEEVHLSYMVLNDHTLKMLTQCKSLEDLYLYGMELMTPNKYSVIFEQCPKLKRIYFICCNISDDLVNEWKEIYPRVSVYTLPRLRCRLNADLLPNMYTLWSTKRKR